MKKQVEELKMLVAKHEAGEISDSGFLSRFVVISAKIRGKYDKDNTALANPSRMGVAKKGTGARISLM